MTDLMLERPDDEKTPYQLTIADGLFGLVGTATAVLRLAGLGQLPLSATEAQEALAVWQFWQPDTLPAVGSPAYFTLTALVTQVLGFSDAVMRLVPALFGVALALLPWLLRRRLGNVGALVTAVFLAISPITTLVARTAGGEGIALFAALLLLIAWLRWQEERNGRWAITLAAALGLGAASAPLFYSALASLALAWLLQKTIGPRPTKLAEETADERETAVWRTPIFVGAGIFLALTTTFLWHIPGLGAATALFADWLAQFGRSAMVPATTPFLAIARYEVGLVIIGLAAMAWAIWRGHSFGRLMLYWLVGILGMMVAQQGVVSNAALAPLAGYLLIGSFIGHVLDNHIHWRGWALTGGLLLVWALIFVSVSRYLRVSVYDAGDLGHIWIAIFGLTLALTTIYFLVTWDARSTVQGILLSILVALVFYNWGTGWWLGHFAANDPRETWVTAGTDDDVRVLAATLHDLSWQTARSLTDLDILSAVNSPVLAWYLRDFVHLQMVDALPPAAAHSAIITSATTEPALGSDYMGADFGLQRTGVVPGFSQSVVLDTLRWWLFHESSSTLEEERLILWLRADLTQ